MRKLREDRKGFSLIELMVVMSVLTILLTIAIPSYQRHTVRANEQVLKENLFQMRDAIDSFYADKRRYPNELEELVTERYLRNLPVDPFTGSSDTWVVEGPEPNSEGQVAEGSVFTVRSGSSKTGPKGVAYKNW